jgi:hypothetical protein
MSSLEKGRCMAGPGLQERRLPGQGKWAGASDIGMPTAWVGGKDSGLSSATRGVAYLHELVIILVQDGLYARGEGFHDVRLHLRGRGGRC